jgi:hypothetical protein
MSQSSFLLNCAATATALGLTVALATSGASAFSPNIVVAADDTAPKAGDTDKGSAKMGKGEGTQSGDQGATEESDTQKIDQPPRRNPATGESSDEDDASPSDSSAGSENPPE